MQTHEWPEVEWRKCKCGMRHSSREFPKTFLEKEWTLPSHPNRKKGGVIMIRPDYTALVTESYALRYGFPKGEWIPHESIEDTAAREFLEETGIDISGVDLSRCLDLRYVSGKVEHVYFLVVVPQDYDPDSLPLDDVETTSIGWVHVSQIRGREFSRVSKWAATSIRMMHRKVHGKPMDPPGIISMPPCKNVR